MESVLQWTKPCYECTFDVWNLMQFVRVQILLEPLSIFWAFGFHLTFCVGVCMHMTHSPRRTSSPRHNTHTQIRKKKWRMGDFYWCGNKRVWWKERGSKREKEAFRGRGRGVWNKVSSISGVEERHSSTVKREDTLTHCHNGGGAAGLQLGGARSQSTTSLTSFFSFLFFSQPIQLTLWPWPM